MKIYVINENTCTRVKLYGMDVINLFKINGWEIVKEKEEADYIAINTCSFLNSKAAFFLNKVRRLYNEKTKKAIGNTVSAMTNAELIRAFDMLT